VRKRRPGGCNVTNHHLAFDVGSAASQVGHMSFSKWLWLGLSSIVLAWAATIQLQAAPKLEFRGMANASAAVRVGDDRLLVGTDENNVLLLYRNTGGNPVASFETSQWLDLTTRNGEVDFEGAARIGEVTFWLGSHGRNNSGEKRPDRQRLLGLRLRAESGAPTLELLGQPVTTLLDQLAAALPLAHFRFAQSAQLAPEQPAGFNLEGLAGGPEQSLVLGLRSPVPEGRALVIPLKNPFEVIAGKPAIFGKAHQLDLGGRGVRDLLWTGQEYYVIGGSPGEGGKSALYRWTGGETPPQRIDIKLPKSLNPEALVLFENSGQRRLLVLSDDGGRSSNETRNLSQRSFRAVWIDL